MSADAAIDLSPEELLAANVNPATRLATDYLNVFNEAVMMIGLVGDCPEMIDELNEWRYLTYKEHFSSGHFQAADVVLAAYETCEPSAREMFDMASDALGDTILETIKELQSVIESGGDAAALSGERAPELQDQISELDGMIQAGGGVATAQDAVDALFD